MTTMNDHLDCSRSCASWRGGLALTLAWLLAGCAMEVSGGDEPEQDAVQLNGGQHTWWRPDVVRLDFWNGSSCSGTLVAHNIVITAAHCLDYQHWDYAAEGSSYGDAVFSQWLDGRGPVTTRVPLWKGVVFTHDPWDLRNDLALMLLRHSKDEYPDLQGVQIGWLATQHAPIGDHVYMFGYGCNRDAPIAGMRQVQHWTYDGSQTWVACPGDSGGPVFGDSVGLFGVVTGECYVDPNDGQWTCRDVWADVPGRRAEIVWFIERWSTYQFV